MSRFIGIDPGAHGALVWMDERGSIIIHKTADTPPIEGLRDSLAGLEHGEKVVAVMELVGGFIAGKFLPGSSMFKMGKSAGYWEGALAALGVRTLIVRPQEWQAGIPGLTGTKGADRKRALRAEAIRRFPTIKVTLDNCDALLLADYCRRLEGRAAA